MADIGHFGTIITIQASNTIPVPVTITHFADDSDPFDLPEVQIGDMVLGTNGDEITWTVANPREVNLAVIPNTISQIALNTIYEANFPQKGSLPARDKITLTRVSPDGSTLTLSGGKMTTGMPATSQSSSGRLKTQTYKFKFSRLFYTPSKEALENI